MPVAERNAPVRGRAEFDTKIADCRNAIRYYCENQHHEDRGSSAHEMLWQQVPKGTYVGHDGSTIKVYTIIVDFTYKDENLHVQVQTRSMDTMDIVYLPLCGPNGFLEPVLLDGKWVARYIRVDD